MGEAEGDQDIVTESEASIGGFAKHSAERMEVETLLSGEADSNDVYLEVHAGAGGTESQDWASMLLRMYLQMGREKRLSNRRLSSRPMAKRLALSRQRLRLKATMLMAGPRPSLGCIVWCASRHLIAMRAAIRALRAYGVIRWLMTRLKWMSPRQMCVLIHSAPVGPGGST
jgi:hypothetical protein